jgi:hypothetical protein
MPKTFRIAIVSDIHYAAATERERCANRNHRAMKNPLVRLTERTFHHFVWLRKHGGHNHLLDRFIEAAGQPDLVVANGDYSCNTGRVGLSDAAAFASAQECLGKLRARFDGRFQATIGDHELGKPDMFSGRGTMALASWPRLVEELKIEPFWRVQLGKNVLLGMTSSLVALPLYKMDSSPDVVAQWERLREVHLQKIREAFGNLKSDERVLLFCHDPAALPFLWQEEIVREKLSQVEQTIIGHYHSGLILGNLRRLSGIPRISFLGKGVAKLSGALGEARQWKPFRVRLCPAITGIQLLKDGGWLTVELDEDAIRPAKFEFHPLKW